MGDSEETSCFHLQKLLTEGMNALSIGTAVAQRPTPTPIDITKQFFDECSKLKLGELAMNESFQLSEAMSAIELMDPKMDIGMIPFDSSIRLDRLISSGRLNVTEMEPSELISTMDAMFATFMSWLEGNSLVQTLYTCVCLHDVESISDPILSSFCYGILELVSTVRNVIQTAAVFEEEDFNGCSFELKGLPSANALLALRSAENELQRRIRQRPKTVDLLEALYYRISFMRLMNLSLAALVPPPVANVPPQILFRPNTEEAVQHMRAACAFLKKIQLTISLGLQPQNSSDGDFGWLPGFEPEVNRKHLPPTFPRKTEMQNRIEGIRSLENLCSRILSIATDFPSRITNIESTFCFLRSFSLSDSCVFSRSLLQLVYLPNDDHIMGRTPLGAVVVDSIRLFSAPPILDPMCPLSTEPRCRAQWDEFISDAVKVFLNVIQMFGHNLARQREKIVCCIEDLYALQNEAERVESDFDAYMGQQVQNISLSLASFVLYHTLLLIEYHFYLSFRLDLFAPFEYPYVYWYMSEVVFKWLINTIDRSHNFIISDYKKSTKDKKKGDRKKGIKTKKELEIRKRISEGQRSLLFYKAQAALTEALFKASVGLTLLGKIRIPAAGTISERLRFEHRMSPFASLTSPLFLNYSQFVQLSKLEALTRMGSTVCFTHAAEAFEAARSQLEKFEGYEAIEAEAASIARICKHNAVVSRILSSGNKIDSQIGFIFGDSSLVYPLLKIS